MPLTIRVLVVDDSALIRQMLTRALSMDPRIDIVGTAKNGVEAIEKARHLLPDVITLDVEMPELTGLEALPHIRKHSNARVVMLSSLDDSDTTYRAMALGAVDFLQKPQAGMASSITELTDVLLKKIKMAYRISPEAAAAAVAEASPDVGEPPVSDQPPAPTERLDVVVGVAASTGGPPALERVFMGLSAEMPAAYLIVQHLPQGFSASLAKRLSAVGPIRVTEATDGETIEPGRAYIAPHGAHMVIERAGNSARIRFTDDAPIHGVRPAADPLFTSIAREFGDHGVAAVLTGMGADGARGAAEVKRVGGEVIVQDEATSVVWGMPGAAMRLGAQIRAVPVGLIGAEIRRAVRTRCEVGELSG